MFAFFDKIKSKKKYKKSIILLTNISQSDIIYLDISRYDIRSVKQMTQQMIDKYLPMTETAYYILLALKKPLHGYGIILDVERMTNKRIRIGAGTIYGTLTKMENDQLIQSIHEEDRRKIYIQTTLGYELLMMEINRLKELYDNGIKGDEINEK